ncbi:MAG: hypothetical protein NTZ83_02075 [Candidatus Pacearchaeota archaeon]|nr:hypothetical protein [Candidatus Pacearchaeota archaeon]
MEGYCTSDGYVDFSPYACPDGCKNGKCIGTLLRDIINAFI